MWVNWVHGVIDRKTYLLLLLATLNDTCGGNSRNHFGKYVVAMNKITQKDNGIFAYRSRIGSICPNYSNNTRVEKWKPYYDCPPTHGEPTLCSRNPCGTLAQKSQKDL